MEIDLVVDLQYGSTGKGLLTGYLAECRGYEGVATCNMPNAGHTYIDSKGQKMIHKVLPNGIVSPKLKYVFIGPGAVFSTDRLEDEFEQAQRLGYLKDAKVIIHPNAVILNTAHVTTEKENLSPIGSTMQGSMMALIDKMARSPVPKESCLARHKYWPDNPQIEIATPVTWMHCINQCTKILAEGSQGFSLGLNQRFWPYCTSRECTPARLLSDMGLPQVKPYVWGTLRTYPIRVGNTPDGYSGDCYLDQHEITWDDLKQKPELTTVTGRVRRVFTFSMAQLNESLWHCRPDSLFLNFCNYMNPVQLGGLTDEIDKIAHEYATGIHLCGYGPNYHNVRPFVAGQNASGGGEEVAHH